MSKSSLLYIPSYISRAEREKLLQEIQQFHPIWEMRYSASNPPPPGQNNRSLLRPVYWLGNWQFACLNYYHPPKGIEYRCVSAEAFPPAMQAMVDDIQERVRQQIPAKDIPFRWELNTCLINYYGQREIDGKWEDMARVGEHKDFEPGPVASVSFGERALFQFVTSASKDHRSHVVKQQWLEDSSLQIFAGEQWKKKTFHRVQRVEDKSSVQTRLPDFQTPGFNTRRLNLTFRFVPRDHIQPLTKFPVVKQQDLQNYVQELAKTSPFWADAGTSNF